MESFLYPNPDKPDSCCPQSTHWPELTLNTLLTPSRAPMGCRKLAAVILSHDTGLQRLPTLPRWTGANSQHTCEVLMSRDTSLCSQLTHLPDCHCSPSTGIAFDP